MATRPNLVTLRPTDAQAPPTRIRAPGTLCRAVAWRAARICQIQPACDALRPAGANLGSRYDGGPHSSTSTAGTVLSIGSLTRGSADTGPRFTALTNEVQAALAARADVPPSISSGPQPQADTRLERTAVVIGESLAVRTHAGNARRNG